MQAKSHLLFKPSGGKAVVTDRPTGWMTAGPTAAVFEGAMMDPPGEVATIIKEARA
jgi:hypothetical protein